MFEVKKLMPVKIKCKIDFIWKLSFNPNYFCLTIEQNDLSYSWQVTVLIKKNYEIDVQMSTLLSASQ